MRIQVITLESRYAEKWEAPFVHSTFDNPIAFDSFDVNVIKLDHEKIWCSTYNTIGSIDNLQAFKNLGVMLSESKKSKNIIMLPQNSYYYYNESSVSDGKYYSNSLLRDMIPVMQKILSSVHKCLDENKTKIISGRNITIINGKEKFSDFYLKNPNSAICTQAQNSEFVTTIAIESLYITTLKMGSPLDVADLLLELGIVGHQAEQKPNWMIGFEAFNDRALKDEITKSEAIIEDAQNKIRLARINLDLNDRYKTILYSNGKELVDVVFEMLNCMFNDALLNFKDKFQEDFSFEIGDKHVVGEIKGVNTNVKNTHILQLETNRQKYIEDKNEDDISIEYSNTQAVLIICHQRKKELAIREPINEEQIKIMEMNNVLTIETTSLLSLFEKYLNEEINSNDCMNIIFGSKGLLKIQ